MPASYVVAAAQMDAEMHVGRALEALVVEFDIGVKHLIRRLVVLLVSFPARQHVLRAKVGQVGVVNLDVPDSLRVENLELFLIRLGNVLEILLVICIHLLRVGRTVHVTKVVPGWRDEGNLDVLPFAFWKQALHQIDLSLVARLSRVSDLVDTDSDVIGHFLCFHERFDVGCISAKHVLGVTLKHAELQLLHSMERFEEGTPEHVSGSKLAEI